MQNHRVKSSTRGGGFCLCSRGFNRRGLWFLGGWAIGFLGGWAIGFLGGCAIAFLGGWAIEFERNVRSHLKSEAVEIPAVGNRVYTNDVRLRGRRGYSQMQNHRVKSSTRGGGFCLCSRGFNRRGFWVSTAGFFVDGRSHFCGWAIEFERNVRSGFWWMGDRVFGGWAIGFLGGWAIGFLVDGGDRVFG